MTINEDRQAFYAAALGHSGSLSDLENEWLKTQVNPDEIASPDMWRAYLAAQGLPTTLSDGMALLPYPLTRGSNGGGVVPALQGFAVATRGVGPSGIIRLGGATDSNYTRIESRLIHYSGAEAITQIQADMPSYFMTLVGGEADLPNPYTVTIAIEYSGQIKFITWGGANSKLIPVAPRTIYTSDVVSLGFTIPANTAFFVQTSWVVANTGEFVYGTDIRAAGTTNDTQFRSTAVVSQVGTVGPWSTPSGGSNSNLGAMISPISLRAPGSRKSVVAVGDSILAFTGDQSGDGSGNAGYLPRAFYIGNGTNKLPYTKLGRPSETASNMIGGKGDQRIKSFVGHTLGICEFGMNDLGQACATVTASPQDKTTAVNALKANYLTIWAALRAATGKAYQTLITPRVLGPTITSLTSAGTVACTATVANTADLPVNGSSVTIVGAAPSAYSGTFTVTSVNTGTNQFTYNAGSVPGSSPATVSANAVITWHDGFVSSTYQRPVDGFEPGGLLRDAINTWIISQVGTTLDGYFDPNPYIEEGTTGKFRTDGGVARTADGLHPNATGAGEAGAGIAVAVYAAA